MKTDLDRYLDVVSSSIRKRIWQFGNNYAPNSMPVFIVGVQRSGTTMLGSCLERSPEIMHYPEHDKRAFNDYIMHDAAIIQQLVSRCPQKAVVFKPLTGSHRVVDLITRFGKGKAIWMYRRYENRASSAVTKFGMHNLELMREFVKGEGLERWQGKGIEKEEIDLIRSFNPDDMKPREAAILFWYIRNKLFFKQGLESNPSVCLVAYESLVKNPEKVMRDLCDYLGCKYYPYMIKGKSLNLPH